MEDSDTAWQKQHKSVISRLSHMLDKSLHTDVRFLVGSNHPAIFEAHKLILASGSYVFESMFYNQSSEITDPIKIPNVEPLGFEIMLRYLYDDSTDFENDAEVFMTLLCADAFAVESLKEICLQRLSELQPSSENVWISLAFSKYYKLAALEDHCTSFIIENARDAFQSEHFLSANMQVLYYVLSLPLLRVTEFELLKFIVKWAKNRKKEETVSLKYLLQPLLRLIHFPSIGPGEFWKFSVENQDVFDTKDRLCIIHHLINSDTYPLPVWCCKNSPRCDLTENILFNLVDTSSRKRAYTSIVKWFECKYEIRVTSKEVLHSDVQTMTIAWGNKPEDLPLDCDIKITWNQNLSFKLNSVKKSHEMQEIVFNFDKKI
ncbi:BTB/POZ domain-containing protein 6-like [Stegodyphus dumicola]|uniref:BTB/POZ domain-containing protein 6-like n=1 Tax=Stegodyphus dumicola TaxID=202533 RepID=UPI0015B0ADB6|nr:BTB/POZ domain-containing protein 6-like [Stegodyphus dumicola]